MKASSHASGCKESWFVRMPSDPPHSSSHLHGPYGLLHVPIVPNTHSVVITEHLQKETRGKREMEPSNCNEVFEVRIRLNGSDSHGAPAEITCQMVVQ